jgi:Protein of unknown function (DUF1553)/Protein of unknown function (DUF1549)/Planctomycete cytochrome C
MDRVLLLLLFAGPVLAASPEEFFENKVRPILAGHCYKCHSDQFGKSKGGLKLDSKTALSNGGDSGAVVDVKKPADSLLMKAVRRKDEVVSAMPPDSPISPEQIKILEQWIGDGAAFPASALPKEDPLKHWAFQPVQKPTIPTVKQADWPRNDIDKFLLAKMEAAGLKPAADAEPRVVARRLAFAITGLPPTLDDLEKIAKDGAKALPKYVQQLLNSPHYGERWARHWMDLVRYADSGGHEYDYEFPGAWRYRDYLVRAFNTDLPYDQFVKEHLAGDLIAPRIKDGRNEALLGTGWWQLQEQASAPVDLPNDEAERLDNMLDVLGKTFHGLTIGCARCHDHKFDPIRTKEYYGLFGIAAASPLHRTWANGPALDEVAKKLLELRQRSDTQGKKWQAVETPKLELGQNTLLGDFSEKMPDGWVLNGHAEIVTDKTAKYRHRQPGLWSDTLSRKLPSYLRSPQFILDHDHIDVLCAGSEATVQLIIGNYQMIRSPIYDGLKKSIGGEDLKWVSFNVARWKGRRVHVEVLTGKVQNEHNILNTEDGIKGSAFGLRAVVLRNGKPMLVPEKIDYMHDDSKPPFLLEEFRKPFADLEATIPAPERFIGIQDVNGTDLPVYARGDAGKPKTEKEPRRYLALAGAAPPTAKSGSGRRELAEVIASAKHPLTARVMVNRVWHHLFGRGLVPTVDNFGLLGEKPSHPELLDYLADRFVTEHKWSVKKLIAELVQTRAYQMQSGPAPQADAGNVLLSRFPLRRLEAETIRDAILQTSGQLDLTFGGEPVPVPHKLKGTGADSGNNYPPDGPIDGQRRRSIYLASRRSFPSVFLEVFDKPPSISTFGKRDVSNVPTQSLTLLNDPFVVGQAKAWAKRITDTGLSQPEQVKRMFREAFARTATEAEVKQSSAFLKDDKTLADLALVLFNVKEFLYVP